MVFAEEGISPSCIMVPYLAYKKIYWLWNLRHFPTWFLMFYILMALHAIKMLSNNDFKIFGCQFLVSLNDCLFSATTPAKMEAELHSRAFLTGETANIADLAMYSYVAQAPEGYISLEPYEAIRAWLQRVEQLPGFVPMQTIAIGLRAN